jgi:hypothetical protein
MTKEVKLAVHTQSVDTAQHIEVIPRKHRALFCNNRGAGRYTGNWVFGWPAKADMSIHVKTQADRKQLKKMR